MSEIIDYRNRLRTHKISEAERRGRNLIGQYIARFQTQLMRLEKKLKEDFSKCYDIELNSELIDQEGGR